MNKKRIVGILSIVIGAIVVFNALPMLIGLTSSIIGLGLMILLALFVFYVIANLLKKDAK